MGRAAARAWAAVLVCVASGGCGYSLHGNLPAHLQTVAVPVLVNRTQEPAVEDLITRGIVEAFTTNGRLKVVRAEHADSILEGEIIGYQLQALSFDQRANVREYRLVVTLNLRFRDVRKNEMLLQEKGVQEKADFRTSAGNVTIARETAALQQAATDIGRAVVNLALERF